MSTPQPGDNLERNLERRYMRNTREIALRFAVDAAADGTEARGDGEKIVELAQQFTNFLEGLVTRHADGIHYDQVGPLSDGEAMEVGMERGEAPPAEEQTEPPVPYWVHQAAVRRVNELEKKHEVTLEDYNRDDQRRKELKVTLKQVVQERDRLEVLLGKARHNLDRQMAELEATRKQRDSYREDLLRVEGQRGRLADRCDQLETHLSKLRDMVLNGEL